MRTETTADQVPVQSWLSGDAERTLANDHRHEWVEMRLRATRACSVFIRDLDLRVEFAAGGELRTEISAKFTRERIEADLEAAGLVLDQWSTDDDQLFGASLSRPRAVGRSE